MGTYQRHYTLSNGLTYDTTHQTHYNAEEHRLYGNFTTVNFPESELGAGWQVRDFVETFIPNGPAVIDSIYHLMHEQELATIHWRHVAFQTERNGSVYTQSEKLTVTNTFDFGAVQNMMNTRAVR